VEDLRLALVERGGPDRDRGPVLDLAPGPREIVCRAWDTAAQTQPERAAQVWNFKGYANNSWHRVRVIAV